MKTSVRTKPVYKTESRRRGDRWSTVKVKTKELEISSLTLTAKTPSDSRLLKKLQVAFDQGFRKLIIQGTEVIASF